jgi:malic enzyme
MKLAAAHAIANLIPDWELTPGIYYYLIYIDYIIPHALNFDVPSAIAFAVAQAAIQTGVA